MRIRNVVWMLLIAMLGTLCASAQQTKKVLFVGNSYTAVNNLPEMVSQIAEAMGDRLEYQSNTPGGCTFSQHCSNQSMWLICQGGWDAVVLQEQSQLPSFPQHQVVSEVFPYAQRLVDSVYAHNPCCEPMFYMTWGRKNGDAQNAASFPVLGTYEGMDSMLCLRYTYMAQQNDAALCPVGRVWHRLRETHPEIELYQSDESHPSTAGTYAAACAFYVMLFHGDPMMITYDPSLPIATSNAIRSAVREVVYDHLGQWQRPLPQAVMDFRYDGDCTVTFYADSQHADSLEWHWGDGHVERTGADQSTTVHHYDTAGTYEVLLVASRHCMRDSAMLTILIPADSSTTALSTVEATLVKVYPNPAGRWLYVEAPLQSVVKLLDAKGCLVFETVVETAPMRIATAHWPAGTYRLCVIRGDAILAKPVVIR